MVIGGAVEAGLRVHLWPSASICDAAPRWAAAVQQLQPQSPVWRWEIFPVQDSGAALSGSFVAAAPAGNGDDVNRRDADPGVVMTKLHRSASVVAAAGLLWLWAASASATMIQFVAASIDGAQETPPNGSVAMASGTFTMDTVANTLSVNVVITVPPPSGEILAHIHGFAPPGTPAGILFGLPLGSPKITVWNFTEPDEAGIIAGLTYVNIHSNAFPGGEIRGQIVRVPTCGDGILDAGETCDDGNLVSGDCCSSLCQVEAAASPCAGDGDPCTVDECDGAGNCGVGAPRRRVPHGVEEPAADQEQHRQHQGQADLEMAEGPGDIAG